MRRSAHATRILSRRAFFLGLVGASLGSISACLPNVAPEGRTPTAAVDPVQSPQPPSPTPSSTATSAPPTVTRAAPTPSPAITPANLLTPTPLASPTPTPTPSYQSPLTGRSYPNPPRKPLAVQIDNDPDARPQSGLVNADIVYEAPTEVGTTRYTAFFGTALPEKIGPVRSVRLIALEVIPQHDGLLVYSGGSIDMLSALYQRGLPALHTGGNAVSASWRTPGRSAPHNLYVSGPDLVAIAMDLEFGGGSDARSLSFGPAGPGGERAGGVTIPFTAGEVEYTYDPGLEQYRRYLAGEPHEDLETGEQITADNVVLLYARFDWMDFVDDDNNERTLGVTLTGEGQAVLLRDGTWYETIWRREDRLDPIRLFDALTDQELPLKMGRTWFAVIPQWLEEVTRNP